MNRAQYILTFFEEKGDWSQKRDDDKERETHARNRMKAGLSTQDKLNALDSARARFQGKALPLSSYAAAQYQRMQQGTAIKGQHFRQTW